MIVVPRAAPGNRPASNAPSRKRQEVERCCGLHQHGAILVKAHRMVIRAKSLAGSDALQREVARDLEEEVAKIEDSGAESIDRVAESEVRHHLQSCEPTLMRSNQATTKSRTRNGMIRQAILV
jgi:hypothetical protein